MNVLITGSAGFVGSHLAECFAREGHDVWGVDNFTTGNLKNWDKTEFCDITEAMQFDAHARACEPELIFHCAASYKDPDDWEGDAETNLSGTINVIRAAGDHGAKLVYFQTALPPVSSYAISKTAAQQYIEQSGVDYLIFRLANVYGPRNLSGPIPAFYKRIKAGEQCAVVKTSREMLYIDDLVEAVVHAQDRTGVYDVCPGYETEIKTLCSYVAGAMDKTATIFLIEPSEDDVKTELDWMKRPLGWHPTIEIQQGIARAVRWYEKNGVGETFTHLAIKG